MLLATTYQPRPARRAQPIGCASLQSTVYILQACDWSVYISSVYIGIVTPTLIGLPSKLLATQRPPYRLADDVTEFPGKYLTSA